MARLTLTYGVLPPFKKFERAFDVELPDGRFEIRFPSHRTKEARAVDRAVGNVGLSSSYSAAGLYWLLEKLVAALNDGDDDAGDLASGILQALEIEWI